jgi:hypothetical protein
MTGLHLQARSARTMKRPFLRGETAHTRAPPPQSQARPELSVAESFGLSPGMEWDLGWYLKSTCLGAPLLWPASSTCADLKRSHPWPVPAAISHVSRAGLHAGCLHAGLFLGRAGSLECRLAVRGALSRSSSDQGTWGLDMRFWLQRRTTPSVSYRGRPARAPARSPQ